MATFSYSFTLALIAVLSVVNVNALMNGNDSRRAEFPYMATIRFRNGKLHCGGAILNNQYILTSGHMLHNHDANEFEVHIGGWGFNDRDSVTEDIDEIKVHPEFTPLRKHHDIALIRTLHKITYTRFIQPVALPKFDFPNVRGEMLLVTGFSFDVIIHQLMGSTRITSMLEYFTPKSIELQECIEKYREINENLVGDLDDTIICTENPTDQAMCDNDEGNPLVQDGFLVGIASDGCDCQTDSPGVYTKVYSHLDWILREMRNADRR